MATGINNGVTTDTRARYVGKKKKRRRQGNKGSRVNRATRRTGRENAFDPDREARWAPDRFRRRRATSGRRGDPKASHVRAQHELVCED